MKVTVIPVVVGALGTVPKWFGKETEGIRYEGKNRDHTNHSITKIGFNTLESPGNRRKSSVTQTTVKKKSVINGGKNLQEVRDVEHEGDGDTSCK